MLKKYIIIILIIIAPNLNAFAGDFNGKGKAKIVLIGIDGLEWSIIERLIKENKMPVFAGLIQKGAYGGLHTYLDYPSPSLWTTIATGKDPELHGIKEYILREKGIYEARSPMSYDRKVKALWNILTDYGRGVGVINYQCTRPPEAINGFMITPGNTEAYPAAWFPDIQAVIRRDFQNVKELLKYAYYQDDTKFSDEISGAIEEATGISIVTPYLYQRFDKHLDLLMLYLYHPDSISHMFWKFMQPEFFQDKAYGLNSNDIEKYCNVIDETYQMVDRFVGKIIKDIIDNDTTVIICSDHGFQRSPSAPRFFLSNLNKILNKMGFLAFKNNASKGSVPEVDFFRTQAYHSRVDKGRGCLIISINLRGREPQGVVKSRMAYLKLKKRIIDRLASLKILETGEKFFEGVSESVSTQGDIEVIPKKHIELQKQHIKINNNVYPISDFYEFLDISGDHSDPGVIIICGRDIKVGEIKGHTHIVDITPTILYLFGLPIAKDMEGKVLTGIIKKGFLKAHPIKYISSYESVGVKKEWQNEGALVEPIDSKQLERLKSLGYVQ